MFYAIFAFLGNITEQILIRHSLHAMNIVVFIFLFYVFGTLAVFLYHFRKKQDLGRFDWRQALQNKHLLAGYIGGSFFGNTLWFMSVLSIGLGMTAFILTFIRLIVAGYAYFFMDDTPSMDRLAALLIGFVALLVFSFTGGSVNVWGCVMAFLSCFGFASELICRKMLVQNNANPENMLMLRQASMLVIWGSIFVASHLLGKDMIEEVNNITLSMFFIIIITACLGGFLVHMFAFKSMETVRLSTYEGLNAMKPVMIAMFSVFLLGESMTSVQIITGAVIILASFYFLNAKTQMKPNSS